MLSKGFVLAALLGWKEARDHQGWGGWFVADLFGIFFPAPSLATQTKKTLQWQHQRLLRLKCSHAFVRDSLFMAKQL